MKHTASLVLIVCVAMSAALVAPSAERHMVAQFSSYDFNKGKRYDFEVYEDDLAQTPSWQTDDEFPPLSPRKAEKLAKSQLKELVEQPDKWRRGAIALHQMSGGDKWVYIVHFSGFHPPGVIDGAVPMMRIVVLMNGRVIKPKTSPHGVDQKTR